jgi:hypothetical protein
VLHHLQLGLQLLELVLQVQELPLLEQRLQLVLLLQVLQLELVLQVQELPLLEQRLQLVLQLVHQVLPRQLVLPGLLVLQNLQLVLCLCLRLDPFFLSFLMFIFNTTITL